MADIFPSPTPIVENNIDSRVLDVIGSYDMRAILYTAEALRQYTSTHTYKPILYI